MSNFFDYYYKLLMYFFLECILWINAYMCITMFHVKHTNIDFYVRFIAN